MEGDRVGGLLVAAQAVALGVLAWPGPRRWRVPSPVATLAALATVGGAVVGAVGARRLGRSLRALPAPPEGAELRRDGVYGLVRHPIYAGLLIGSGGFAVLRGRVEPLAAWAVLSGVLHAKSGYEERLLEARFGRAYADYRREVPALVPRWPV